jgi:putative inorganic carbon (HCO3(-)) transporter
VARGQSTALFDLRLERLIIEAQVSIRDLVLFAVVFGAIPFIVWRPYIGVLYWVWLGLMNPHRLTWGPAFDFPFALTVAVATFVGIFVTKDERRWKAGPEVYLLIALLVWMSITTLQALEPVEAAELWKRVMKIQVMGFVALIVLHSRQHIELLVWVLALSVAYYGVKGGIFTILHGGDFRVWGPADSYIEDNNALALATVMTIPLLHHLFTMSNRWWLRLGLAGAMVLCAFSALGSHSRGALIAIGAMGIFLWLHSRNKLVFGAVIAFLVPVLLAFMPTRWDERMQTIVDYEGESSAEARLATWGMLFRVANDRFFGTGFAPYTRKLFDMYMPEWPSVHSAHSIYFQLLGEHGWVGLSLFLTMWFLVWRCSVWIIKNTRHRDDLKWAHSLSSMIQVSLIGYLVGGTFLNLGYWDVPYYELVLLVLLRDLIRRESSGKADDPRAEPRRVSSESAVAGSEPTATTTRVVTATLERGLSDPSEPKASRVLSTNQANAEEANAPRSK